VATGIEKFPEGCLWRAVVLIFASVGTNQLHFDRFVKGVDNLASQITEEVVIQIGYCLYRPRYARYFEFCEFRKMLSFVKKASIVVAHAGFGIIGECIRCNKGLVLVPREYRFGEAVDNQVELAEYLAEHAESIICVRDVSKLREAVEIIKKITPCYNFKTMIPEIIRDFVNRKLVLFQQC